MLDAEEINVEIARLEYAPSSYDNYHKLAALYVIRDHINGGPPEPMPDYSGGYSSAPPPDTDISPDTIRTDGDSFFLRAVNGRPSRAVWGILDELMETLAMVNERAYNTVMDQIEQL